MQCDGLVRRARRGESAAATVADNWIFWKICLRRLRKGGPHGYA